MPAAARGDAARASDESLYEALTKRVLINLDDVNEFARELSAEGANLAQQLFPPELVRLLWQERDRLTVHVKSWEPYIPWEIARLVHPDSREVDERFLAEYDLVRSFSGSSRPKRAEARSLERARRGLSERRSRNPWLRRKTARFSTCSKAWDHAGGSADDAGRRLRSPGRSGVRRAAPWSATGAPIMTTSTAPSS